MHRHAITRPFLVVALSGARRLQRGNRRFRHPCATTGRDGCAIAYDLAFAHQRPADRFTEPPTHANSRTVRRLAAGRDVAGAFDGRRARGGWLAGRCHRTWHIHVDVREWTGATRS